MTLSANLNYNNQKINEGTLTFKIGNYEIGTVNVINGKAELNYTLDFNPGRYTLTASYSSENYNNLENTGTLIINRRNLNLITNPIQSSLGEGILITTNYYDENGSSAIGITVMSVYIDNELIHSKASDTGQISTGYTIPTTTTLGTHIISIMLENSYYNTKSINTTLEVTKTTASSTIENITGKINQTITLIANISTPNQIINEGIVEFKINNQIIGTQKVSENIARLSYIIPTTY